MEEGERGTPASHLPRFSPSMSTELLTEPKPKKHEAGTRYLEDIQTRCLCLQGEVRQAKAQLKSKPAKVGRVKEQGYCKNTKNKRKTKKTVGPLLSDTGHRAGSACKAHPWQNRLDNIKCEDKNFCVCESNMQNCLTEPLPKTGHVEEQEDHQLD